MPSPTPEDADVNDVREVTGEISRTLIASLIDNLNDAEWARALDLTAAWREITPGDLLSLEGGRDGVRLSDQEGLDDIRRRMRLLLGLPEFRDADITGAAVSTSVPVLWVY
jgi:hypothetical protein